MRIAQVAPLHESVPPKYYGGTERIVSYLTEELVRRGHQVTLFASGDSETAGELIASCSEALRLKGDCQAPDAYATIQLGQVSEYTDRFDIIHFHTDYSHFPLSRRWNVPAVTTLHGRLDLPELAAVYEQFPEARVISISDAQRRPLPRANWQKTVYHGLPPDQYAFHGSPGSYLAFIGRISPEKRVDRAIEMARAVDLPLKIAAKVDSADQTYFEREVEPLLDVPQVDFIGEIGEEEKGDFLGNAAALLFPIDWPEPFGLVMIEAFACGTPVIAYPHGAVPEIMQNGRSGFIVESIEEAARAIAHVSNFDRWRCRSYFEERFTVANMVDAYEKLYEQLAQQTTSSGSSILGISSLDGRSGKNTSPAVPQHD